MNLFRLFEANRPVTTPIIRCPEVDGIDFSRIQPREHLPNPRFLVAANAVYLTSYAIFLFPDKRYVRQRRDEHWEWKLDSHPVATERDDTREFCSPLGHVNLLATILELNRRQKTEDMIDSTNGLTIFYPDWSNKSARNRSQPEICKKSNQALRKSRETRRVEKSSPRRSPLLVQQPDVCGTG